MTYSPTTRCPAAGTNALTGEWVTIMVFTLRFVIALALGALMIAWSGRVPGLQMAGVLVIALVVVAAAADWLALARVRLEATRQCDEKLSLGADNPVRLNIRNASMVRLRGKIRDEYPVGMNAPGHEAPLDLPARSEATVTYRLRPSRRGDYAFGDTYLRLRGPLGMMVRQIRMDTRRSVKVYPNLLDMRSYDVSLRVARPLQAGERVAAVRGRGTEFESLREYLPDDEMRSVDWKASARRGRLMTRQYQQERSQNVMLLLDCGRTMGGVISGLTRLDHAVNAAMMLAHVASRKGDRVGMLAFGEDILSFAPPRAGRSQTLALLSAAYNLKDAEGDSAYAGAFAFLNRRWTRRSLLVVMTDLADPHSSAVLAAHLAGAAKKHLCVCVCLSDPAIAAAAGGPIERPEDAYRAAAAREVIQARRAAAAVLAGSGVAVIDVNPGQLTPALVDKYLQIKARGGL